MTITAWLKVCSFNCTPSTNQMHATTSGGDKSGRPGKLRPTAAMMAKVTDHLWSFDEFYETVIQYN